MKKQIEQFIKSYITEYQKRPEITTVYGEPLVGFADAYHPYIQELRSVIGPTHVLPQDVMADAKVVIAYYVPFTKELAATNREGRMSSPEWARTYEETNAMFGELNQALIEWIESLSGEGTEPRDEPGPGADPEPSEETGLAPRAAVSPKASTFDQEKLVSDWSQRHMAYAAGLGTFGLNNMLITREGCCGRYSTVVTNLDLEPDAPLEEEYCLFKRNGSCGVCARNCPTGALTESGYDRFKCYALCQENAEIYTEFGSSYESEDGDGANSVGSEVCGKCVTGSPCAFRGLA